MKEVAVMYPGYTTARCFDPPMQWDRAAPILVSVSVSGQYHRLLHSIATGHNNSSSTDSIISLSYA